MMGPEAVSVSTQDIGAMMYRIYGVPTLSLSRSAARDLLSSGQLTDDSWVDIRLALAEMLSTVQVAENSSLELRQMRPAIMEHMQGSVAGLDIVRQNPLMAGYPSSRFNADSDALMADMEFESLIAFYAIRMELNRNNVQDLLDRHSAVINMIENNK
jgi:hypothetical protein